MAANRRKKPPQAPSTTARKIRLPYPKDADGNPLCRWCRTKVEWPRKSWCSDKCVEEYRDRYDNRHQRRMVRRRDRGVCALCHLDTVALARRVTETFKSTPKPAREAASVALLVAAGFTAQDLRWKARGLCSLWQADHTVPVVEGGGGARWETLRTLCTACHRKETNALMRRRRALASGPL